MLLCGSVFADEIPDPGDAYETQVWILDENGDWDGSPSTNPDVPDRTVLARAWASGENEGFCNQKYWHIPVYVHASIAQWCDWHMTGTRWDWYVRKPGFYATTCITANIASNGDILIDYDGFDDLESIEGNEHNNFIPAWYSFGASFQGAIANGWVRAADLNNDDDLLDEGYLNGQNNPAGWNLHTGITWKLFNRIQVVDCNTACEYADEAEIVLCLEGQKPWIEDDDGFFVDPFRGPNHFQP
jgi:hypothetical protein